MKLTKAFSSCFWNCGWWDCKFWKKEEIVWFYV